MSDIRYRAKVTSSDASRFVRAVAFPIGTLLLCFITISRFAAFGKAIIAPASALMWLFGVLVAICVPAQRRDTLGKTHTAIVAYLASLLLLRYLIGKASGVSSEMLMASYNQAISLTAGSNISSFLQNALWIAAFTVPIGFVGMEVKVLLTLRKKASAAKYFEQTRSIR